MLVHRTQLEGVLLLEPRVFADERGYFLENFNERVFQEIGIGARFVQDNQSQSKQHVLRGLHFQVEKPQGKLIRVLRGEIFDVVVDLRPESASYGKWAGMSLTGDRHQLLWIPTGIAHGFYVNSETADVIYKVTEFYDPGSERTLLWNDPDLAIRWPFKGIPILSEKDRRGCKFRDLPAL